MNEKQIEELIENLEHKKIQFADGLTNEELEIVESKFKLRFPPDLKLFLQTKLPISENFVNWKLGINSEIESQKIIEKINWPLKGLLFDIKENDFWLHEWSDKPDTLEERIEIAKEKFSNFPKLIPIYSHRYIPETPYRNGNPIFSVYQMDIIYYGFDLANYFSSEFDFKLSNNFEKLERPINHIEFWSDFVENY